MAELLRYFAGLLKPDLEEKLASAKEDFGPISFQAALDARGNPQRLAELLQEPGLNVSRLNQALEAIDQLEVVADALEAAGFQSLPQDTYAEMFATLTSQATEPETPRTTTPAIPHRKTETPELQSMGKVRAMLSIGYRDLLRLMQDLNEGTDFVTKKKGRRTFRWLTPQGIKKIQASLIQAREPMAPAARPDSQPSIERKYIDQARPRALGMIADIEPKSGFFRHASLQEIAKATLRSPQPSEGDLADAYSYLSEIKGNFNSGIRGYAAKFGLVSVEEIISQHIMSEKQRLEKSGQEIDPQWEETLNYISNHFGKSTIEDFIAGVTNRFSSGLEWLVLKEVSDNIATVNNIKALKLGQLTLGVHYRRKGNLIELSTIGATLVTDSLRKIRGNFTSQKFINSLRRTLDDKKDREKFLHTITPDRQTWNGNFMICSFLRNEHVQHRLKADLLPNLPGHQSGEYSSFIQLAEKHQLVQSGHYSSLIGWFKSEIEKDARRRDRHSLPFISDLEEVSARENGLILERLCLTTENWLEHATQEQKHMYGYRFMHALISEIKRSPMAQAVFSEIIVDFYRKIRNYDIS